MIEFAVIAGGRQRGAVDEQLGAGQRLGRAAVGDALEAHHDDIAGRTDVDDLEGPAVAGKKRAVAGEPKRIAGEGLDPELALDAVGSADHGHEDGISRCLHVGFGRRFTGC